MSTHHNENIGFRIECDDLNSISMSELVTAAYTKLHQRARHIFKDERRDHTLQPTALLHEAIIRLLDEDPSQWKNLGHFYAVAAQTMRRVLVDYARAHNASKRKHLRGEFSEELADRSALTFDNPDNVLAVDLALNRLAEINSRRAEIAELRFFAGLTIGEVAQALNIGRTTVKDEWKSAIDWLQRELE